jgi:tape measure domain-containing protein
MGALSGALGSLWVEIGARIEGFTSGMTEVENRLESGLSEINRKIGSVDFGALGQSLTSAGVALTASITAPLAGIGAASVSAAAEMDSLVRGLTAVTGSSAEANVQLERLKEVAKLPGLGFQEAVQGSINLQAAGFSAKDAEAALRGFGNALATVGKGKSDLDGVILALGQIASKGKISAEEINQLAERVPQIRQIMQTAFGTADTEVLQKAGIGAQQFVNTVTAELLKLPPVTGGLKTDFENFSDNVNQALSAIGTNLAPIISSALGLLSSLLVQVQGAAHWFSQLPEPIQNAAVALGAMLAAAGPLALAIGAVITAVTTISTAIAPVAGAIGVTVGAFSAWALAIPLVVAALVALGSWVYDNWEPIVAVVTQAWDGITEAWDAIWSSAINVVVGPWKTIAQAASPIWDPIAKFFHTIWDGLETYFGKAWDGIEGALGKVWKNIKTAASKIWGGITSVFETFLEWAAKIPGANKLMNLDDTWKSAKKASEEISKVAKETENVSKKADAAGGGPSKPIPKLAGAIKSVGTEAKTTHEKMGDLIKRNPILDEMAKQLETSHRNWAREMAAARLALGNLEGGMPPMIQASDSLKKSIDDTIAAMGATKIAAPQFSKDIQDAIGLAVKEPPKVTAAFDECVSTIENSLGTHATNQSGEWQAITGDAKTKIGTISGTWSGILGTIHSDTKNPTTGLPGLKGAWDKFSGDVGTTIGNLTKDIGGKLFRGDASFVSDGLKGIKDLGSAFVNDFANVLTATGTDLLNGVISDLIGGKGFGGIIDQVKNAGKAITDIFGNGGVGAVAGGGSGIPTGGGGGIPGGGGGAGGAGSAGSLAGTISAIANVGTLISSVIGNFQNARQETTLNAIEHNTRYSMMYLGERGDGGILGRLFDIADKMQFVPGLLDALNAKADNWLQPLGDHLDAIKSSISGSSWIQRRLDEISHNTMYGSQADRDNGSLLQTMRDVLQSSGRTPTITVSINGVTVPSSAITLSTQGLL